MISVDDVRTALREVADPCSIATGVPVDIVDMGLISGIEVTDSTVTVTMRLTSPFCMQFGLIREQIEKILTPVIGLDKLCVEVDHTAEWWPEMMDADAQQRLRGVRPLPVVIR